MTREEADRWSSGEITREEAISYLREEQDQGDMIVAHLNADAVLRKLLISLGYGDVVAEFDKVGKTYDLPVCADSKALARR